MTDPGDSNKVVENLGEMVGKNMWASSTNGHVLKSLPIQRYYLESVTYSESLLLSVYE